MKISQTIKLLLVLLITLNIAFSLEKHSLRKSISGQNTDSEENNTQEMATTTTKQPATTTTKTDTTTTKKTTTPTTSSKTTSTTPAPAPAAQQEPLESECSKIMLRSLIWIIIWAFVLFAAYQLLALLSEKFLPSRDYAIFFFFNFVVLLAYFLIIEHFAGTINYFEMVSGFLFTALNSFVLVTFVYFKKQSIAEQQLALKAERQQAKVQPAKNRFGKKQQQQEEEVQEDVEEIYVEPTVPLPIVLFAFAVAVFFGVYWFRFVLRTKHNIIEDYVSNIEGSTWVALVYFAISCIGILIKDLDLQTECQSMISNVVAQLGNGIVMFILLHTPYILETALVMGFIIVITFVFVFNTFAIAIGFYKGALSEQSLKVTVVVSNALILVWFLIQNY